MVRVGVRELRQHAGRYLERVKAGETIELTERGRLVAVLAPPTPAMTALDRLIAEGKVVPATAPFRLPKRVPAKPGQPSLSQILDELREERLP
jgi:prevent-host-death family protein